MCENVSASHVKLLACSGKRVESGPSFCWTSLASVSSHFPFPSITQRRDSISESSFPTFRSICHYVDKWHRDSISKHSFQMLQKVLSFDTYLFS
jgi:hypothetical protein